MPRKCKFTRRVNILKYIKVGKKWRFAKAIERNGKLIRDHVLIAGVDEHHPEGTYYIEWYEIGSRRRRKTVLNFDCVIEEARQKAVEIAAMRAGILDSGSTSVGSTLTRLAVGTAIDNYLEFIENHRSKNTYRAYGYTLHTLFRQSCTKTYVSDVGRDDILKFITDCYRLGLGDRTVYDKVVVVLQMFKRYGKTKLIEANDWPKYDNKIPSTYEREEIEAMLRHADDDEEIFLRFMLESGFRDREAQFVAWSDIDFDEGVVRLTPKPIWGFRPESWEQRAVSLPVLLLSKLRAAKRRRNALASHLVFPNSRGNPNRENDMIVKRVAHRAKLNCGRCLTRHRNKCSEGPYCQHYCLSKFRNTFAAEHARRGVDLSTLQVWMGHRDAKSTLAYVEYVPPKDVLALVNGGTLARYCSMKRTSQLQFEN